MEGTEMELSEVKPVSIVKYDLRRKNGELIYTVTYEVIQVTADGVRLDVISPRHLRNELEITARDFKAFYP